MKKIIALLLLLIIFSGCTSKNTVTLPTGGTGGNGTENPTGPEPSKPIATSTEPAPPPTKTCTFEYNDWSGCATDGTQSRTIAKASPDDCSGGDPILSQSCIYEPLPISGTVDYTQAENFVGEYKTVRGKVVGVHYDVKSDTTFLNFCFDYKICPFSSVVFSSDKKNFGDLKQYESKTVEISGLVKTYKGSAEIILKYSSQINIVK